VQEAFTRDPHGGDLYVFRGKSGKLIGNARRIDAGEMDRLRLIAEKTELANAIGCVERVRRKMLASRSAPCREAAAALGAALNALDADANGTGPAF